MGELALIFGFIIVALIVLGISVNAIVAKVLNFKREQQNLSSSSSAPQVNEVAERQQIIEDRVQVLERLATDRGTLLSDEIEKLRDDRREREAG